MNYYHIIHQAPEYMVSNGGEVLNTIPMNYSEHNYKSRLTYEQVILIRKLAANGVKSKVLASRFNHSHGATCNIIARRRWKDV